MIRLMMDRTHFARLTSAAATARANMNADYKEMCNYITEVRREDVQGVSGIVARLKIDEPVYFEPSPWECFGCVSTESIVDALHEVLEDAAVHTIVLELNCPGGTVAGWDDLRAAIRAARETKRVVALVHDGAFSLGMRMACLCEEIVATPTALVGSIGTIVLVYDDSAMYAEAGIIAKPIASDAFKAQGNAGVPITDEYLAHMKAELVDVDYEEFVAEVAASRGISVERVKEIGSRVYGAAAALQMKLIDRIENADAYVAELAAALPQQDPRPAQGDGNGAKGVTMTVAELKAKFPELTAEIEQGAVAGAASEMAAQAAKPATFAELKAEFGTDSAFIVTALEGGLTLSAARKQWADKVNKERAELSAKLASQEARLKELETLPGRGVEAAIPSGGNKAGAGSDYMAVVAANQAAGMNQGQAHVAAQKSHPALYAAYCAKIGGALRGE